MIEIAEGLSVDAGELATERVGILGASGSGKTYLGTKIAEELYKAGAPFLVIDPVGKWAPGLRVAADGKSPGLPVVVIGGAFADIPLDPERGSVIGRFLREKQASAVVDVSAILDEHQIFVAELCKAVYRSSQQISTPYSIIYEEVQFFAPQVLENKHDKVMLSAVRRNVRIGRNHGMGSIMLSQRPESVNKEVLNQAECLFVGNMRGPQERKTVQGWIVHKELDMKEQLRQLPSLKPGEFFCWSPSWLEVFQKIKVLPKWTFDSSSTPKLGAKKLSAAKLSPIELGELAALLAQPATEEGGFDPAQVDARIAELAAEVTELKATLAAREAFIAEVRELARKVSDVLERERVAAERATSIDEHTDALGDLALTGIIEGRALPLSAGLRAQLEQRAERRARRLPPGESFARTVHERAVHERSRSKPSAQKSEGYSADILGVIAQHGALTKFQIALLSGKSIKSSQFALTLSALEKEGLVERRSSRYSATKTGVAAARPSALPKGRALYDYWFRRFGDYDRRTFEAIALGKKTGLTREELAQAAGHSIKSSQFSLSIGKFKKLELFVEHGRKLTLPDDVRRLMGL